MSLWAGYQQLLITYYFAQYLHMTGGDNTNTEIILSD